MRSWPWEAGPGPALLALLTVLPVAPGRSPRRPRIRPPAQHSVVAQCTTVPCNTCLFAAGTHGSGSNQLGMAIVPYALLVDLLWVRRWWCAAATEGGVGPHACTSICEFPSRPGAHLPQRGTRSHGFREPRSEPERTRFKPRQAQLPYLCASRRSGPFPAPMFPRLGHPSISEEGSGEAFVCMYVSFRFSSGSTSTLARFSAWYPSWAWSGDSPDRG